MAGSCSTVYSLWQVTVERFGIKHLAGMALHEVCFANVADYEAPAVTRVSVVTALFTLTEEVTTSCKIGK